MKYIWLIPASCLAFMACNPSSKSSAKEKNKEPVAGADIKKAEWLIGKWQADMPDGSVVEIWEKKNDTVYSGEGFFIGGRDTFPGETMTLQKSGKDLLYIPVVPGENAGKPVTFTLTSMTEKQMVFENPEHDFPQKITYTLIAVDSVKAEISGKVKGEEKSQGYTMHRKK